ncbi:MAG: DNA-processing protein DprA [Syntrophobacterales bacterium]|nr:DNA-processing protein DprA [Syntrophobacterales bacterium]
MAQAPENIKYWLALKFVEGLGNIGVRNLLRSFGTPERIFRTPLSLLCTVEGIGTKTAAGIKDFQDWQRIDEEIDRMERCGAVAVTCQDPRFPKRLLHIYDCPFLLYVKGELPAADMYIAMVGSRAASAYGRFTTERLSRELTLQGAVVISGMARGIDTAAHRGALSVKGKTVAVLGSGIDVVYPPENEGLYHEIAGSGAVVTEYAMGTPPNAPHFPSRNRIISGMALGVVVVEATDKSGSLITARIALEQGREVFAVPGGIDAAGSRGTNRLIKEGAKLVENVHDILDEIRPQLSKTNAATETSGKVTTAGMKRESSVTASEKTMSASERALLAALSRQPRHIDELIAATGLNAPEVLALLLQLELRGLIRRTAGNKYILQE